MNLEKLSIRLCGLLLLFGCLAIYDPIGASAVQRLGVPIVMALGAWALVQNLTAVAFGTAVLALLHTDLGGTDWITAYAYPLLAVVGMAILIAAGWSRFRRRVADTHAARWSSRRPEG